MGRAKIEVRLQYSPIIHLFWSVRASFTTLIWNNDNRLKFFDLRTQIQDLWANKDSALRHVMGRWSALIERRIVICEVGFQDLQLANMP